MRLADLLDVDVLRKLADANYAATGMPVGIIDAVDGSVLVGFGWQDICTMYHRVNPVTAERCRESDNYIKGHLGETQPCEYTCRNGLRDIGIPIRVAGQHLATLFLGQFFYEGESPDREFFVDQARQFGFDEAAYLAALDRVPVFRRATVENMLTYDTALARVISDLAEGALRRREAEAQAEFLARFPQENPDPVVRLASDFTVLYANEAAQANLRGIGVATGSPAPDGLQELARRAVAERRCIQGEVSAGPRVLSVSIVAVGDEVNVYAHDITARKRAEESLDREHALLESVTHATDVMLVYLDREFNFVWMNAAYAATCNRSPDELVGKNHFALYPHAENEAIFRRVRDTGEPVFYKDKPFEFPDQPKRGVTYWDWSLVPMKDPGGNVQGLVFSLRETTKYKRAELELDAERMRWRGVVEGIADEVWVCDANGKMSLINLPETTAMALDPFEGKTIHEVLEELDILYLDGTPRPAEEGPLLRSLRSGEVVRGEEMVRHRKTGRLRYRQYSCAPMRDVAGRTTGAVGIVRDITEMKRIEETLRESDRRKDEFMGMLSHELRNPLAPIRNSLYILDHAEPSGQQARRAKEVANRQLGHLTRLVDDLLDVTRIARGKIELRRTDVDISAVATRTGEDHRVLMHERGLELTVAVLEEEMWVDGDETRLAQIIGNLLQNAAKFTPPGGEVTLAVVRKGDTVEVCVRDSGSGIDAIFLETIFQPFVQAKQSLARTEGGLGLGLALAKGLVELHGGSISVASGGIGQGAQFTVRLPLLRAVKGWKQDGEAVATDTTSRRVLVVEDNKDAAESLADLVKTFGHHVEIAFDGPTAIEKASAHPPDVVLCDIGLPGMTGYEVAQVLRSDPRFHAVHLVAVTGYAQPEDRQRALDAGFAEHIAKPADPAKVLRVLQGRK